MTKPAIDTHNLTVTFGKHRGERWTRIPVSYLRWLVNNTNTFNTVQPDPSPREIAQAELDRRGISAADRLVEISAHAIDSASLRCLRAWKTTRTDQTEGLHAWLNRKCEEALNTAEPDKQGRIHYDGFRFVFESGSLYPVLKTIMRDKKNPKTSRAMRHFETVDNQEKHHE